MCTGYFQSLTLFLYNLYHITIWDCKSGQSCSYAIHILRSVIGTCTILLSSQPENLKGVYGENAKCKCYELTVQPADERIFPRR